MFNKIREKLILIKNLTANFFPPYNFWIFLVLVLGVFFSVLVFQTFIKKPEVGIIRISGPIFFQEQAREIVEMIRYAREKKEIKAIVLDIDSPGGAASPIEEIYLTLLKLRTKKPIVASINQQGASGGYYLAIASNFIYAKPDSQIGSIGAWTTLPWPETISEEVLPTGPFKDTGMTRQKAVGQLEMLRQSFLEAVLFQRGKKLKISPEELAKAEVYLGLEGLRYGLIDGLGSGLEAIEKSAKLAGIRKYKVIDINEEISKEKVGATVEGPSQPATEKALLPTFYYLIEKP